MVGEMCIYFQLNEGDCICLYSYAVQTPKSFFFLNNVREVVEKVRRERVLTTNSQGTAAMK